VAGIFVICQEIPKFKVVYDIKNFTAGQNFGLKRQLIPHVTTI